MSRIAYFLERFPSTEISHYSLAFFKNGDFVHFSKFTVADSEDWTRDHERQLRAALNCAVLPRRSAGLQASGSEPAAGHPDMSATVRASST